MENVTKNVFISEKAPQGVYMKYQATAVSGLKSCEQI